MLLEFTFITEWEIEKKSDDANISLYEHFYQVNGILVQKAPCDTAIILYKI